LDFGGTAICEIVSSGDEKGLRLLLASGADVNQTNKGGQTPLILAIVSGRVRLIPVLLNAGADPLLRDGTGLNAIEWAERKGHADVVKLLKGGSTTDAASASRKRDRETAEGVPQARPRAAASPTSEVSNKEGLSDLEKSRRWVAGIKQRLDEKANREQTPGFDKSGGFYDVAPHQSQETTADEKVLARAESLDTTVDQDTSNPVIASQSSSNPIIASESSSVVLEPRRSSRKKCPKCNTVYNGDVVTYCVYHVVPLVDIDTPVKVAEDGTRKTPLLWLMVIVTFLGAALAGLFLFGPRGTQRGSTVAPSSTPSPVTMWKGTAIADSNLKTRVVELPPAQTVLKIDRSETVVVRVRIDSAGRVLSVQSALGNEELRRAAMDAARRATFSADKLHGREAVGTITYTFNL
jgi:TonB family protein